jgi:anti-sigma B factor antagonist
MKIKKIENNEDILLTLSGSLDKLSAKKMWKSLQTALQQTKSEIELDFAEVTYMSVDGLCVILKGEKQAKAAGKSITLKNVSTEVFEVLEKTGFSDILTVVK